MHAPRIKTGLSWANSLARSRRVGVGRRARCSGGHWVKCPLWKDAGEHAVAHPRPPVSSALAPTGVLSSCGTLPTIPQPARIAPDHVHYGIGRGFARKGSGTMNDLYLPCNDGVAVKYRKSWPRTNSLVLVRVFTFELSSLSRFVCG